MDSPAFINNSWHYLTAQFFYKIAIKMLGTPAHFDEYAHSLLFDVQGWTSYMAY
jgi:hypothetical protein